jgi:hypothetical protein
VCGTKATNDISRIKERRVFVQFVEVYDMLRGAWFVGKKGNLAPGEDDNSFVRIVGESVFEDGCANEACGPHE